MGVVQDADRDPSHAEFIAREEEGTLLARVVRPIGLGDRAVGIHFRAERDRARGGPLGRQAEDQRVVDLVAVGPIGRPDRGCFPWRPWQCGSGGVPSVKDSRHRRRLDRSALAAEPDEDAGDCALVGDQPDRVFDVLRHLDDLDSADGQIERGVRPEVREDRSEKPAEALPRKRREIDQVADREIAYYIKTSCFWI